MRCARRSRATRTRRASDSRRDDASEDAALRSTRGSALGHRDLGGRDLVSRSATSPLGHCCADARRRATCGCCRALRPSLVIWAGLVLRALRWRVPGRTRRSRLPLGPRFPSDRDSVHGEQLFPLRSASCVRALGGLARDVGALGPRRCSAPWSLERGIDAAAISRSRSLLIGGSRSHSASAARPRVRPAAGTRRAPLLAGATRAHRGPRRDRRASCPRDSASRSAASIEQVALGLGGIRDARGLAIVIAPHGAALGRDLADSASVRATRARHRPRVDARGLSRCADDHGRGRSGGRAPAAPGFVGAYHVACVRCCGASGSPRTRALALGTLAHARVLALDHRPGCIALRGGRTSLGDALRGAQAEARER